MSNGRKACSECGLWFGLEELAPTNRTPGPRCRSCHNAYKRANYKKSPRTKEQNRIAQVKRYGISLEEYGVLFDRQGGVCAICAASPNGRQLSVDHDHDTDEIRGLLCHSCNVAIGLFHDDPDVLDAAALYLKGVYTVG